MSLAVAQVKVVAAAAIGTSSAARTRPRSAARQPGLAVRAGVPAAPLFGSVLPRMPRSAVFCMRIVPLCEAVQRMLRHPGACREPGGRLHSDA
jgi:hypothetical protein